MRIDISGSACLTTISAPRTFTAFSALLVDDRTPASVNAALGDLGHYDGEHVWVVVSELERELRLESPSDADSFQAMVEYAMSMGWVSDDSRSLRAHLETV